MSTIILEHKDASPFISALIASTKDGTKEGEDVANTLKGYLANKHLAATLKAVLVPLEAYVGVHLIQPMGVRICTMLFPYFAFA
jgi:hypothetical protein